MKHPIGRVPASAAALLLCCTVNAQALDAKRLAVNIQPQPVLGALKQLGEQTGLQLLIRVDNLTVEGVTTPPVNGELTLGAALDQLLSKTGLEYEVINERTVRISRTGSRPTSNVRTPETFRLAQVSSSDAAAPAASTQAEVPPSPPGKLSSMEQVVVTAQKREENLRDVPVPVTAIGADALVDNNQVRIQDYYSRIPGLNFLGGGAFGTRKLTIRGLPPIGGGNSTVGILVDDVPFGTTIGSSYGAYAPDVDPSELTRIEVLRGPQGTLYGSSTIGGLLKFVTTDPSPDAFAGRVQVSTNSVRNGDDLGYGVRAAVNIPLSETWAVRLSGSTRHDPGYIDDPGRGLDGINETDVNSGRLSALWRPSQEFSLKLSALVQRSKSDGFTEVDVSLPDLQQNRLRGTGLYDQDIQAFSAVANVSLGKADLTSLTGYNVNELYGVVDHTNLQGAIAQTNFGVSGASYFNSYRTEKLSQELRFTVPFGERFEWMIGGFYTHEDTGAGKPGAALQQIDAADPATGASRGLLLDIRRDSFKYDEYAAFTNVTVHFTDRFNVQVGGRQTRIRQDETPTVQTGRPPLVAGGRTERPGISFTQDAFTYLVTPQFRISSELMLYARFASGFRAGGVNSSLAPPGASPTYEPDKTENYEVGFKGSFLDEMFAFDTSVYYIDWKDLQARIRDPATGFLYFANGGSARSRGIELSLETRPIEGMTIATWATWNDAELAENLPPIPSTVGLAGDRLPYTSRFSGNLSLDQQFRLSDRVTAFAGGSVSYIGDRLEIFGPTRDRARFPAYAQTDLRAGATFDSWTFSAFVNNVADRRGVLGPGSATRVGSLAYTQPRTFGLSAAKDF